MGADRLFVGIDGGGTHCRARIVDSQGHRLGEGKAGPANLRLGVDRTFHSIETAVRAALGGVARLDVVGRLHAAAGLAGFVLPSDRAAALAHAHPFAQLTLDSDAYVACLGAHGGEDGAVLILGTGSCGLALVGGQRFGVGGWGFPVSDQGGGASLGREAVRMALWAHEQVLRPTDFSRAVMTRLGGTPDDVVMWADTAEPHDYANFAPMVFEYEAKGDAIARAIVVRAVDHVGKMVSALVNRGAPRVVLVGGVASAIAPHLPPTIQKFLGQAQGDPLDGALLLARRGGRT